MEIGEKLLCKKNYRYRVTVNRSKLGRWGFGKKLFKKGNYYKITDISSPMYILETEFGRDYSIPDTQVAEFFHNPKEIRKLKLKKIKKAVENQRLF